LERSARYTLPNKTDNQPGAPPQQVELAIVPPGFDSDLEEVAGPRGLNLLRVEINPRVTMPHNFAAAAPEEQFVYGAQRPGYPADSPTAEDTEEWVQFMQSRGIERVCCLLGDQLEGYDDLLGTYRATFGTKNVCHAPITDYSVVSESTLFETILPFLRTSVERDSQVVVHCSAGSGRTGHVLVAWLVCDRGYALQTAIDTVEDTGRRPLERKSYRDLEVLLDDCL
jgi:protein-tyrosine phosphatase